MNIGDRIMIQPDTFGPELKVEKDKGFCRARPAYPGEEYIVLTDAVEKKKISRAARNKNRAGKGPIRFPSDYKTKKERDAMNGEVATYNLRRPMKWKEFKAMPEDLQRDYLRYIDDVFNPSAATLGVMFGVSSASVLTARKALGVINPHGGRANNGWNPAAWEEWVTQQQEEASTPESFPSIEDVPQKSREEEPFSVSGGEFTLIATPAELAQLLTVIGGGRAA